MNSVAVLSRCEKSEREFFYLDASALAKRYVPEIGTPVINRLFSKVAHDRFYVFNIGVAEVASMLVRQRNTNRLSLMDFSQAMVNLGTEVTTAASVSKLAADNQLVADSLPLIVTHSINATDGVILRSALNLAMDLRAHGDDLVLLTADHRLLKAAQAEGLLIFNPETQTSTDLDALL